MNKRTIDEMISYFNQEVSNMDIAREYKMALLGMITAIGYESKKQEVVRCKECKFKPHWDEKTESAVFPIPDRCPCECDDYFYSWVPNDDWFCADGKRKEEDDGE